MKRICNVHVPCPNHLSALQSFSTVRPKLRVWLPAELSLQRLTAVLAGYGVELRQLTPEQFSTLLTLLQLLPKGTGRNLGECPVREASSSHLHGGYCRGEFGGFLLLDMGSCCSLGCSENPCSCLYLQSLGYRHGPAAWLEREFF